jgi:tetratricopeptide (TPR) repeat protein
MKKLSRLIALSVLAASALVPAGANAFKVSEDLDLNIRNGLYQLYNLHFDEAERIFKSVKDQAPEHPMVAFGLASVHWWKMSAYVLETDEEESKKFLDAADDCIRLSKEKIERGDPTGEGYLTLGGAYGLVGRWQATNQKWLPAYFTGKKAIKYLRKALKINPEMYDADMGLGIFDYYVATLPSFVRSLAFLGSNNDPNVGLQELETAARDGTYSKTPSKLFLVEIYSNPANKPERAMEILHDLRADYPRSPFIHMLHIITLYNESKMDDAKQEVESFGQKIEDKSYPGDVLVQYHFARAMVHLKSREWPEAIKEYDMSIATGTIKNPFYTWARLYRGYALDAAGRRDEAVAEYKEVLAEPRRWGSWDAAKKRLGKPWTGDDKQLAKLNL